MSRRTTVLIGLLVVFAVNAHAQDLRTATAFFDEVSRRYGGIEDYTAEITITNESSVSHGMLLFSNPDRMRIDFEQPEDQIIVSDGERLQVYIPQYNVVLSQQLTQRGEEPLATMANEQGLRLMRQNYSIAYMDSPGMVPLDTDSGEMVTKLRLNWRSTAEGYRQLILSINEDLLIRRITGITADYREIQFDFQNVDINAGIPENRFEYRGPASANTFYDFLFEGEG